MTLWNLWQSLYSLANVEGGDANKVVFKMKCQDLSFEYRVEAFFFFFAPTEDKE